MQHRSLLAVQLFRVPGIIFYAAYTRFWKRHLCLSSYCKGEADGAGHASYDAGYLASPYVTFGLEEDTFCFSTFPQILQGSIGSA